MSLHHRIARELGWTEAQAMSFSLFTLRELVAHRAQHGSAGASKVLADIQHTLSTGNIVLGAKRRFRGT